MVPRAITELRANREVEVSQISDKKIGAFCALARPSSFFKSLSEMNVKVKAHLCLTDHANYDQRAIKTLTRFKDLNQLELLVTTTKDAVKLPKSLNLPIITLESDLVLDRPEEFLRQTLSRLN
jgi:tetraacyldisaccharide 4'-kinase